MITVTISKDGTVSVAWPPGTSRADIDAACAGVLNRPDTDRERLLRLVRAIDGVGRAAATGAWSSEDMEDRIRDEINDRKTGQKQLDDIEETVERYVEREDATPLNDRVDQLGQLMCRQRSARGIAEDDALKQKKLIDAIDSLTKGADAVVADQLLVTVRALIAAHNTPPVAKDEDIPF